MVKIKKTQIYKNLKKKKINFITSKNKYINKQNKKTRNYLNTRTLDALKQYGYGYISKNQYGGIHEDANRDATREVDSDVTREVDSDVTRSLGLNGGFIIEHLKLKYKLSEFKNFINKFRKEEINIKKYIDSYEGKVETFKQLGVDKAIKVTTFIINFRRKVIFEFINQNVENEKLVKTSNLEHQIELINNKLLGIDESIKSYEKSVKKEVPMFKKYNIALKKDSKNFLKLVKFFETKIRKYYDTIKQIKISYNLYHGKKHIASEDTKKIKKYKKFSKDIDYILTFTDKDISNMTELQDSIDTILNKGKDYLEKFESLEKENFSEDLEKWKDNYKSIYENFGPVNENIDKLIENIKELKNNFEGMLVQAQSIYVAGSSKDKNLYLSTNDVITNCNRFIDLLKLFKGSVNKLKTVILNETPFDKIELDLVYIEGGLKDIETQLDIYKKGISDDKINIENELSAPSQGGGKNSQKNLKLMKGGAYLNNLSYEEFFELDYAEFKKLLKKDFEEFKKADDLYIKNTQHTYNKILTLFNIYLFAMYFEYVGDVGCNIITALSIGQPFLHDKDIIQKFLQIIIIYYIAEKTKIGAEYNFNATIINLIKEYIDDMKVKLEQIIQIRMFAHMDNILITTPLQLQDLVCDYSSGALIQKYNNAGKNDTTVNNFIRLIIKFVEDSPNDKINIKSNIKHILTNKDKIKDHTFAKHFELNDYNTFFNNIYKDQYDNVLMKPLLGKKSSLNTTDPYENYVLQLVELLNLPDNIPSTVKDLLNTPPVPLTGTPPVPLTPIPTTATTTGTTVTTATPATGTPATPTGTGALLQAPSLTPTVSKPKFLFNIEKFKNINLVRINLNNIKNHITTIINIINQQLTTTVFSSITNNINKINENVNILKLIEPKLLTAKIDDYDKVVLKYDWLKDNYKMNDETKIEITETKEIAQLLHDIIPSKQISVTTSSISNDDMLNLMLKFMSPDPKNFPQDVILKLKDKNNANTFLTFLDTKYPDSSEKSKICTILHNIKDIYQVDTSIYDKLRSDDCKRFTEDKNKKKVAKDAEALRLAASLVAKPTP